MYYSSSENPKKILHSACFDVGTYLIYIQIKAHTQKNVMKVHVHDFADKNTSTVRC